MTKWLRLMVSTGLQRFQVFESFLVILVVGGLLILVLAYIFVDLYLVYSFGSSLPPKNKMVPEKF